MVLVKFARSIFLESSCFLKFDTCLVRSYMSPSDRTDNEGGILAEGI
jgi:hypothetical protein